MAEIQQPENSASAQASNGSTSVGSLNAENVGGNVVAGNNNVVNNTINNYFPVVEKNTEKHEPDYWALKHPYPMPPNFTGRIAERAMLTHWLKEDTVNRLFILRALGGFGKSALTWQWLTHDVDIKEYPKVVFWSFYEGDASFEHFIEETLKYLNHKVPESKREQVDELLTALQSQKVLLIMDGFERLLRAYGNMNASHQGDEDKKLNDADRDCVNLNVEHFLKGICSMPSMKSKALMTTRLTPRALERYGQFIQGCREEELKAMDKADAIAFFRAQGVRKGTNHEIEDICRLYGFHPLSLRLLVGHIMTDFKNPGDIVVAQKLRVSGDVLEHQNHILEVAYNGLPPRQQKLLSTIACLRSSTKLDTLESIAENKDSLDDDLHDLMERGLLQFNKANSIFDLHPIVRRFAYDRLTAPDRTSAHGILIIYFEAVPQPQKIEKLEDLARVIELYHHMVRAGKYDEAKDLYENRLSNQIYFQFGAYQIEIELLSALFIDGEAKPPRLTKESSQAWILNSLAGSYALSGQPRRAVSILKNVVLTPEKMDNKRNVAIRLGNMATQQLVIGALKEAESNLLSAIEVDKELGSEFDEAADSQELGLVLFYRGVWQEAKQELDKSLELFLKARSTKDWISKHWAYRSQLAILTKRQEDALSFAQEALKLSIQDTTESGGLLRDFIRDYWLLGTAYRMNNDLTLAEENLSKALNLCRQINAVNAEADILLDLARLRYDQKNYEEAKSLADEALLITERCGYVLQGTDVNLFLAQYALEQEQDKVKAKQYAEEAKKLATCDGPPYYYKVAYEEADRLLASLNV